MTPTSTASWLALLIFATGGHLINDALCPTPAAAQTIPSITDTLTFGNTASEQSHNVVATESDVVAGGLGESARRLLPRQTPDKQPDWQGGSVTFTLKVDPARPNYFTIRLWGEDVTVNRLLLLVGGKQVGYRHLGDVEQLDFGSDHPAYRGRFFYNTTPLPLGLTHGKTQINCEIRSSGRIWGYGMTFEQYQKPMTEPTRGLYRVYTHTDGYFVPPTDEKQGAVAQTPLRQGPGPEVLEQLKARVNRDVANFLASAKPLSQMQMQLLARAYHVKWTPAFQNLQAVSQIVKSLDAIFRAYRANPKLAEADPSTWNPEWYGLGPSGQVITLLAEPLKARLDEEIEDGAEGKITRRAAFSEMLIASRDWHRRNRRLYTNQSMINDLYGIYLSNRGVAVVDPAKALPESEARRYLYESVGLQPWLGSDTDTGPSKSAGENYLQLTAKGLTKELGYVGNYGEVLD